MRSQKLYVDFDYSQGAGTLSPASFKGQLHKVRRFALLNRSHGKSEVTRTQRFEAGMPPWRVNSLLASWKNSKKPSVAGEDRRWKMGKRATSRGLTALCKDFGFKLRVKVTEFHLRSTKKVRDGMALDSSAPLTEHPRRQQSVEG